MSAEDNELINGFGLAPLEGEPLLTGRRTKKRWSFHDQQRPNWPPVANPDIPIDTRARRQRRMSDFTGDIDAVHAKIDLSYISPAQLYSTESGRLFHAGKICIALAGLPGRGKTHLLVSLTRYLRWLGVKTHVFHLGDYRRAEGGDDLSLELFMPAENTNHSPSTSDSEEAKKSAAFRQRIFDECISDITNFFHKDNGQVAIYDAVNATPEQRENLVKQFSEHQIQTLFIELLVTDDKIVAKNMEQAAKYSPDYKNWDYKKAYHDYKDRIQLLTPYYIEMNETDSNHGISYIKFVNFGERIELHNLNYGYLINKVVFFLMNLRIKSGSVFMARCWKNSLDYSYDPPLDEKGIEYAKNLTDTILEYREAALSSTASLANSVPMSKAASFVHNANSPSTKDYQISIQNVLTRAAESITKERSGAGVDSSEVVTPNLNIRAAKKTQPFLVWTSTKQRTIETTQFLRDRDIPIRHRVQLTQKNPGVVHGMSEEEIESKYPLEYEQYLVDPYHHRFQRAELYHDLAIKIEPLILEMERLSGDVLIIADDTVLKVFYGYLMLYLCYDIPKLNFLQDEIIEIKFNAYLNSANRIPLRKSE